MRPAQLKQRREVRAAPALPVFDIAALTIQAYEAAAKHSRERVESEHKAAMTATMTFISINEISLRIIFAARFGLTPEQLTERNV